MPDPHAQDRAAQHVHAGRGIASNPESAGDYQDYLGLLPDGHHPRVSLAGLWRIPDFVSLLQKAFPEITNQPSLDVAEWMRTIFPPMMNWATRRVAVELVVRCAISRGGHRSTTSCDRCRVRRSRPPLARELQTSAIPGSTSNVGDGFYHYHRAVGNDRSLTGRSPRCRGYARSVRAGEPLDLQLRGFAMISQPADR